MILNQWREVQRQLELNKIYQGLRVSDDRPRYVFNNFSRHELEKRGRKIKSIFVPGHGIKFYRPIFGASPGTYYMRADGTAASVALAVGPGSSQGDCMNISVHNAGGATIIAGDLIYCCDDGGNFVSQATAPSSGSGENPIIYRAEPGDTPIFDGEDTRSTCFSVYNRSYITLDGLTLKDATARGLYLNTSIYIVVQNGAFSGGARGLEVENNTNCSNLTVYLSTFANHTGTGLQYNYCPNSLIYYVTAHDCGSNGIGANYSGGTELHHNICYNNNANGIMCSYGDGYLVHHNYCYNNSVGSTQYAEIGIEVDSEACYIHDNLLINSDNSGIISNSPNSFYYHNTIYNPDAGCISLGPWGGTNPTGNTFRNNVFYIIDEGAYAVTFWGAGFDPDTNDFDYNQLYYSSGPDKSDLWKSSVTSYTFDRNFAQTQAAGHEAHGQNSDPQFLNAGTDFRLQSDSPCINTGAVLTYSRDTDYEDKPVGRGPVPDMGCLETLKGGPRRL